MLIDNRDDYARLGGGAGGGMTAVADFIRKYTGLESGREGALDIVTGYFTIAGLNLLYKELSPNNAYRMVLSELAGDDDFMSRVIDLLQGDSGIESSLNLSEAAKNAVAFLKRETVAVKAITNSFCHAKAYVYKDASDDTHDYYVMGSSNLTEAGLGLHASSNVELNFAQTGSTNAEYGQLRRWFKKQWETVAQDRIALDAKNPASKKIDVKQYFIERIEACFGRTHTPEEIYYKILFELFNGEMELEPDALAEREMALLQDSTIYRTLFDYQKKGVVSLIKMLRKWNGAILADAVGLGKTFSALAVMKYFQNNGYQVLMLCPKKLEQNWKQYRRKQGSRFDRDEFDYVVRFHTDLQDDRMETDGEVKLSWLLKQPKLLVVVDESHNLRNDKSRRYKTLLDDILSPTATDKARDVKVLLLSATPINNGLTDIRNQFKLIARGDNAAFDTDDFQVGNLETLFRSANNRFREWCEKPNRTIGAFIESLPPHFFDLTDRLIVARTRHMVEKTLGEDLGFPKKAPPANEYVGLNGIGDYPDVASVYDALLKTNLTAYQPTQYMAPLEKATAGGKGWQDDTYREKFLVKMMAVLFMKRLESCWHSCMKTIEKVLDVHERTLDKVNAFLEWKDAHGAAEAGSGEDEISISVPDGAEEEDADEDEAFTLRDATISLAKMARIQDFRKGLEADVQALSAFYDNLATFEAKFKAGTVKDGKLSRLLEILEAKQSESNRKALVFTTFGDTAEYLYGQIRKAHPEWRIACITGQSVTTSETCEPKKGQTAFQGVLQRFAPRAKLYHEFDWSDLYADAGLRETCYDGETKKWNVPYGQWRETVGMFDPDTQKILDAEIDILIATDCLSEGQNLQDADLVVNYDIHWNPVRLIQRFGRIDRIGSANKVVRAVNFWPTKSYNEYLHLTGRINNRMALMRLAGTETQPTDEELAKIVKDDPTIDHNTQKLLDQIANADISEIEETVAGDAGSGNLGLQDFSLEVFRQDLQDFFKKHRDLFLQMPSGVFSGFRQGSFQTGLTGLTGLKESGNLVNPVNPVKKEMLPESLVAVLGYPRRKAGDGKRPYEKIYLLCQPVASHTAPRSDGGEDGSVSHGGGMKEMNTASILGFLRKNKGVATDIPAWILTNDKERLSKLSATLRKWMEAKKPAEVKKALLEQFSGLAKPKKSEPKLEDVFKPENFDLICWEYVSR